MKMSVATVATGRSVGQAMVQPGDLEAVVSLSRVCQAKLEHSTINSSKKLAIGITLVLFLPLLAFCHPPVYVAKDIRGQVVDEQTGQPLEGVIVVARWGLREEVVPGFAYSDGSLKIVEVVTDKNGRYFVAGWGPMPRPPFHFLDDADPELIIFKNQYDALGLSNETREQPNTATVRKSMWDGQVLKLQRPKGTPEEQANRLSSAYTSLSTTRPQLRSFPRLFLAMNAERVRLISLGIRPGFSAGIPNVEALNERDREFLKGLQK
jgi:hypothetical protein